ncbi:hypothetical protein B0H63DRAFT_302670 [Podospora didyma]|uniref:Uncharacterized protein n=1 Tax=Podospora didyma TaxID=330526 RepID=A0AAE0K9N5_9PEZI|nr:hypothetical protein B0H63DRAFT_302670 [Podospora didyma]
MAQVCTYPGSPDLYGLGLRTGIYLLWFALLLGSFIAKTTVTTLRFILSLFISASFLAWIIQTSNNALRPVDAYIVLLLTYGVYYWLIPVYLWRLVTACNPFWDPTRWPKVPTTTVYRRMELLLVLGLTCFQMWFWSTGINSLPRDGGVGNGCGVVQGGEEWGFFFSKVPLHAGLFVAVNIVFAVFLLVCVTVSLGLELGCWVPPRWMRRNERRFERHLDRLESQGEDEYPWRRGLQTLQALSNLTVTTTLVVAIELTIQWNNLTAVNDTSTVSQMVPLIIGAGLMAHVFYVWFNPRHDREIRRAIDPYYWRRRGSSKSSSEGTSTTGGGGGGGPGGDPWRRPGVAFVRPAYYPPGRVFGTPFSPGGPRGPPPPGGAPRVVTAEGPSSQSSASSAAPAAA